MPFLSIYLWHISFIFLGFFGLIQAQISVNGQTFTNGLAILNSPSRDTPFHVGTKLPISIEVSGNGELPAPALIPGSGLSTRYDALHIFLVSSQSNLNLTVSTGEELLTAEIGSVRHLDWPIPACIPAGQYNLTLYETSHINSEPYFIITPIPISIDNTSPAQCLSGVNDIQPQPQVSSPFAEPPFLPDTQINISTGLAQPYNGHTIEPTMPTASSATVVVVSVVTITTTELGVPMTTIITTTKTTMTVMQTTDNSGFFPVNGSPRNRAVNLLPLSSLLGLWALLSFL